MQSFVAIKQFKGIKSYTVPKMNDKINNVVLDKENKEVYYYQVDYKTKKSTWNDEYLEN